MEGCATKATQESSYCAFHVKQRDECKRVVANRAKQELLRTDSEARELHKFYKSKKWRELRGWQLATEPMCRECGGAAQMVDHVRRIRAGGERLRKENLQSLCHECHNSKRGREAKESLKKKEKSGSI